LDLKLLARHSGNLNPDDSAFLKNLLTWMRVTDKQLVDELSSEIFLKILEFCFLSLLHENSRVQLLVSLLGLVWKAETSFLERKYVAL